MVKIRLSRTGKKNYANYRVVITNNREKRESNFLEYVGFFNPHNKEINLEKERINYWLSVGAQPTDTVKNLLVKSGILQKPAFKKVFAKKAGKKSTERASK